MGKTAIFDLDGTLVELEEKWGIKPTAFLAKQQELIQQTTPMPE